MTHALWKIYIHSYFVHGYCPISAHSLAPTLVSTSTPYTYSGRRASGLNSTTWVTDYYPMVTDKPQSVSSRVSVLQSYTISNCMYKIIRFLINIVIYCSYTLDSGKSLPEIM